METTYTIRAGDGREYGPATLDQLTGWIREGRVNPNTEVRRSDMEHWSPASSFAELNAPFTPAAASAAPPSLAATQAQPGLDAGLVAQMKSGASWFYWIAALSLINSISAFTGSEWRFIVGLGATQVFDVIGAQIGGAGKIITLALDLVAAGALVLFGVFGHKGHLWAFLVGMVLFGLDTFVFVIGQDWIGVAFHLFVLFCLFRGFQACRQLKAA